MIPLCLYCRNPTVNVIQLYDFQAVTCKDCAHRLVAGIEIDFPELDEPRITILFFGPELSSRPLGICQVENNMKANEKLYEVCKLLTDQIEVMR